MSSNAVAWRLPVLTLDAEANLPRHVEAQPDEMGATYLAGTHLLDRLTSSLVPNAELSEILRELGAKAAAESTAWEGADPSRAESARATRSGSPGLRASEIDERIRYDAFFGIRRVASISPESLAHSVLMTVSMSLLDLADAQVGHAEVVAILRGVVVATAWIPYRRSNAVPVPLGAMDCQFRFRVGHLLFAVMANFGAHHLRLAIDEVAGTIDASRLLTAATFVRASTAAMWFSTAFSSSSYSLTVRPPMDAASTRDHGFSGLDNYDFRVMREAWERVADVAQTLDLDEEDREALSVLFETVIEDNEHHALIASAMVGLQPSLKHERVMANLPGAVKFAAVAALRLNTDERRELFVRFVTN